MLEYDFSYKAYCLCLHGRKIFFPGLIIQNIMFMYSLNSLFI